MYLTAGDSTLRPEGTPCFKYAVQSGNWRLDSASIGNCACSFDKTHDPCLCEGRLCRLLSAVSYLAHASLSVQKARSSENADATLAEGHPWGKIHVSHFYSTSLKRICGLTK